MMPIQMAGGHWLRDAEISTLSNQGGDVRRQLGRQGCESQFESWVNSAGQSGSADYSGV